jgi:hypothetical protein
MKAGGERGIRTPGTLPGTVVFKTTAIDHSAISPFIDRRGPLHPAWRPSLALLSCGHLVKLGARWFRTPLGVGSLGVGVDSSQAIIASTVS